MLIDTHCHLGDPAFDADRDAVIERMRAAEVGRALVVESELDRLDRTCAWARGDEWRVATACHPHEAVRWTSEMERRLCEAWQLGSVAAVGEIGLDYHYDHSPRDVQARVFDRQLAIAVEMKLPVIIHAREADADIAAGLLRYPDLTVVLHSFSSGDELLASAIDTGWYVSFSGMITFKSWRAPARLTSITADRLMVETDAPYLAPVPHRGKRNEPAFVAHTARHLAGLFGVDEAEMRRVTTANATRVFWQTPADY